MSERSTLGGAAVLVIVAVACGSSTEPAAAPPAEPERTGVGPVEDAGTSKEDGCAEATKNIFVVSEERVLYSFSPPTLAFTEVGLLACGSGTATPTSMAVDRKGIAWVRYSDGSLWNVDTATLACSATAYLSPNTDQAFFKYGMGFSSTTSGGSVEQLFLSDTAGVGLARLDTAKLALGYVGPYTGALAGRKSELTGTGEGKLYGFFVTSPAQIAEIAKDTGAILSTKVLTGVEAGQSWAFSFYGGDFYIYTTRGTTAEGGSDVTRYRPADDTIEVVKPKVGFKIVGAGVSTCAPTRGPR